VVLQTEITVDQSVVAPMIKH